MLGAKDNVCAKVVFFNVSCTLCCLVQHNSLCAKLVSFYLLSPSSASSFFKTVFKTKKNYLLHTQHIHFAYKSVIN
jgi:hypothetical protein